MVPFTSDIEEDQHVVLRAMAWHDFEALLAIRGDRASVRLYYLDGEIELTSSTRIHEERKKTLARKAVRALRDALRAKKRRS